MSKDINQQVSAKASLAGIVIGAALALLFAKMGSPGLIGVGAVIGTSIGAKLNERQAR